MKAAKEVMFDVEQEHHPREETEAEKESRAKAESIEYTGCQKQLYDVETFLFTEDTEGYEDGELQADLKKMMSTEFAFVVFETEDKRNEALEALEEAGGTFEFEG